MLKQIPKKPKPGAPDSIKMGCICPVSDNQQGKGHLGLKGVFIISSHCPLHQHKPSYEELIRTFLETHKK